MKKGIIQAIFTLSDRNGIYISKGKNYDLLLDENNNLYIYDNFGVKTELKSDKLKYRFSVIE